MKEGDKFKVIEESAGFDVGTIVTFTRYEEDDSTIAWFTGTTKFNGVDEWPVILTKVVPYEDGRTILVSSKETTPTSKALYGEEEEEVDKYATCEERGWKEGDLFTYICDYRLFPEGDIIELINDDGTYMPLFRSVESGDEYFVYTFKVKPYVAPVEDSEEYTGGSSDYYKVVIKNPTTFDPYVAECNDVIEALDMNFAEGNIFKALWRKAAARQGKRKAGHNEQYDNEKILFFAQRLNGLRGE